MAGQFVSRAYVVLLRKSIPQRAPYKLPLCLTLEKNMRITLILIGMAFLSGCYQTMPVYSNGVGTQTYYRPAPVVPQDVCSRLTGASIVANDGTFLGNLTNSYDSKSVLNEYGTHGSKYSASSIWNAYGQYGGEYSQNSPFNSYSNNPPMIIKNGNVIGYLTTNKFKQGAVNPYVLKTCEF